MIWKWEFDNFSNCLQLQLEGLKAFLISLFSGRNSEVFLFLLVVFAFLEPSLKGS